MTHFLRTVLLSYGVIAFSAHPIPAGLIMAATFFHPIVGWMGLVGNIVSNLVARWIHANEEACKAGVYGVSGILIGLALGMYAEPSVRMWIFLIAGSAFAGVLSVMLGNLLVRYDLPILSIPFMMVIWLLLVNLGITKSDSSLFLTIPFLQNIDRWLFDVLPLELFEFIKMFGNILFQENLISGVLVFIALMLYSRISALYGLWGGLLGMSTYTFIHGSLDGFHGLNFVLTALAFGGFFIVNNRHGFLFTSLAVMAVGLVDLGTVAILSNLSNGLQGDLPSLVFAFNVVTLTFLLPLKLVPHTIEPLRLTPVPLYLIRSPESNRRWYQRWSGSRSHQRTILTFPFAGEWTVLQGNKGEWTHKGVGRYAWDFIVRDLRKHQSGGMGLNVEDFYAYGLPVLAPAPGTICAVENAVEDNPPQRVNVERSWGNYVIIDHGNSEFSELSHFQQGSIVVAPGQHVNRGDLLGNCGNSGRSPVPHIHFQLQSAPALGAPTLPVFFSEGVKNGSIYINFIPEVDDILSSIEFESKAEWSLLGRETEQWIFSVQKGFFRFTETYMFGTDAYGFPAIISENNTLWHIIDQPTFIRLKPDFKTFPSLLSRSVWMDIVGDELILPKKLLADLKWDQGQVIGKSDSWLVETKGMTFHINPEIGITQVQLKNNPKFQFILKERRIRKQ